MELEEAIDICKAIKKNIRYKSKFDLNILKLNQNNEEAIETVLQALEELQQKEKSRIIGNINEIKIENLEPILKPYYIPKEKVINKLNEIEEMIDKTTKGELQKYTVGELIFQRTIYNKLLEE